MAKIGFTKDELATASEEGTAAVAFAVSGAHIKGFPFRSYSQNVLASPAMAKEAVLWFDGWADRVRMAQDAEEG